MLYIVATPIGNLKDITLRALETLKEIDGIICEDTRHASLLLNHYQIKKPLLVLNDFNEAKTVPSILEKLQAGQNLALISDAGTPLISDPGYKLVRQCLLEGVKVDSLPGPSAAITALTLSGLPPDKFLFLGYPPEKKGKRISWLTHLMAMQIEATMIVYLSPHKMQKQLDDFKFVFGDIQITLAKELTKIYQNVETKLISQWLLEFKVKPPKGEWILLLHP